MTRVNSTCPHDCPSTCALEIEKLDSRTIGRVYGANNSYTAGIVCAKVARYAERIHHPDRLSLPLRRVNAKNASVAEFVPVSWDSALDEIAARFQKIIAEWGAEAIWPYHYAGTMGLVQRDGIERLRNCLGTSRQHSTFCTTLADAGWLAGIGVKRGSDSRLIAESDVVVIWGGNPVNTQVNLMHHITLAKKRGGKLVVVDPYLTATAEKSDMHLMLKPGTDGALACALIHIILRDSLEDRDYLLEHTDFSQDLRTHFATCTPQWAADITGLDIVEIEAFAALYASTKKSFIRPGYGFSRTRNGSVNMHAVTCLPALTGAWRVRGGGALYSNGSLYPVDKTLIEGSDVARTDTRIFDQSRIGDVLTGNPQDLQDGPPVKALFVQNTNPVVVAPESAKVKQGLMRDDLFVCVHEQFMTDTAQLADLVLPATMFAEHDDVYVASGHTHIQMTKAIIEPFAESRSNHEVLVEIAKRLGLEHRGFRLSAWQLCDETLKRSGLPDARSLLDKKWHDCLPSFEIGNFHDGFGTEDGKFHFKPDWQSLGPRHHEMPALPTHWNIIDNSSEDYPLRLVAAPARQFLNTTFTETESSIKKEQRPTLLMHPDDMQSSQVDNGQRVRVQSQCGSITVHAKIFSGLQRGTVVMESIWPNSAFEDGLGVNTLVSAEPGFPNGGAVFHDTAVVVSAFPK